MKAAWWLLGLCALASGCSLVTSAARNVIVETRLCLDDLAEHNRNRKWAQAAWNQVCCESGEVAGKDYEHGFKDGFLDYLEGGGNGEPPTLPPKRYWQSCYQTPQGRQAVQDWFSGFRHGAAVAREDGYRDLVTLPCSVHRPRPGPNGTPPPQPAPEELPAPRPVTAAATWGLVDVKVAGGWTFKWPARFVPVEP